MRRFLGMLMVMVFGAVVLSFADTVFQDSIDGNTGLTGWQSSGSDVEYYTGSYKIGTASLRVRYNGSATATVDTTGFDTLSLTFKLAAYSLETGETIEMQYNTGASWVTVGSLGDGQDNGVFNSFTVNLPAAASENANFQIRVIISSSSSYDYGYLEDVEIIGTATGGGGGTPTETWNSESQNVSSPNFPNNYPNDQNVVSVFTKSGATKMKVHFSNFDTESGYDYVYILDGSDNQIASYCGSKVAFTSIEVSGDTIKVKFTSDYSVTRSGWKVDSLEWFGVGGETNTNTGGETNTNTGGSNEWLTDSESITSANYPNNYPNNQDVVSTITKAGASKIKVHFSAFQLESGYDFVYILDGNNNEVVTYTGSKGAFTTAEVTGDTLKVRFTSDYSVTALGWKIDSVEYYTDGTNGGESTNTNSGTGTIVTIYGDNFDGTTSSIAGWQKGSASYVTRNTDSIKIGTASMKIVKNYDAITYIKVGPFDNMNLSFKMAASSFESGENIVCQYDIGSGWVTAATLVDGEDNGAFRSYSVAIPEGSILKIKFRVNASSTWDYGYIDDILLTGEWK